MVMRRRLHLYVLFAIALLLVAVDPADAGCCTIVTLDTVPRDVRAGESVEVVFTVQARGVAVDLSTLSDDPPTVFARNPENSKAITVIARTTTQKGEYLAEITFPHPGTWEWGVTPTPFSTVHLEPLTVLPSASTNAAYRLPNVVPAVLILTVFLVSGLGVLVRRGALKGQAAVVLGVVGVSIVLVSAHVVGSAPPTIAAPATAATDDIAYGRALFVAKGCTTCHVHADISSNASMSIGPNLTAYQPAPDFVRRWLRNPKAIRPNTFMPDLDLTETEIDALLAFLDAEHQTR